MINFTPKSWCQKVYGRRMAGVWLGAILWAAPAAATDLQDLVMGCEDYALSGNPVPSFGNPAGGYPQPNMSYRYVAIYGPTGAPIKLAMDEQSGFLGTSRKCTIQWGRLSESDVDKIVLAFLAASKGQGFERFQTEETEVVRVYVEKCVPGAQLFGAAFSIKGTDLHIVVAGNEPAPNDVLATCVEGTS